ncbi:hypothetical protein MAR_028807 [Mya arenaria]|uniref:Uncharacterized protein n=1 Tax=Mya arenaria TaxID=6604 RepID=A0ABY7DEN5_MYAAR|nr:hypothetical protein MAR_028807 [Mya arenaria]
MHKLSDTSHIFKWVPSYHYRVSTVLRRITMMVEFFAPGMSIMDTQSHLQMFAHFFCNFNKTFTGDEDVVI